MPHKKIYEQLIDNITKYHPSSDFSLIEKAYELAKTAHEGQFRKSGDPYIEHPLKVAVILTEIYQDRETIAAAILHDIVEDTEYTVNDIAEMFGAEVALLVDGVTNLEKIEFVTKEDEQATNYRKMFKQIEKDIRIILIKIADRLHNLRTLQHMPLEKQANKAQETLEIYAALANKLGISKLRRELEDLSFQYLHPAIYQELVNEVNKKLYELESIISTTVSELKKRFEETGIRAEIEWRTKGYFHIYKKLLAENKPLDQAYNIFSVRIVVDTPQNCYLSLWLVHDMFKPLGGRFEDHIAIPKDNLYQSLHSTVSGPNGEPIEIQIRTDAMHRASEYGITANWSYKAGMQGLSEDDKTAQKYALLRDMLDWQLNIADSAKFLEAVRDDLDAYRGHVYCFTPKNHTKSLLSGSTVLDFAYSVHSAVGNKMIGARVNNREVPFDYILKTGDRVEIETSEKSKGPSPEWLEIAKSSQAKNKIHHWFNSLNKESNMAKGKQLLEKEAAKKGVPISELVKPEILQPILRRYNMMDWDAACAACGHGGIREAQFINRLYDEYIRITNPDANLTRKPMRNRDVADEILNLISVTGIDSPRVILARCCNPQPGNAVKANHTRGRNVTIHRHNCPNIAPEKLDRNRVLDAQWPVLITKSPEPAMLMVNYKVNITITAFNQNKLLHDITGVLYKEKANIYSCSAVPDEEDDSRGFIDLKFEVQNPIVYESVIKQLRKVNGIIDITRK